MSAIVIDGIVLSAKIKKEIKEEVELLKRQGKNVPKLAVVMVGNDAASSIYVEKKRKACYSVGFDSLIIKLSSDINENDLTNVIYELNTDPNVTGILVQLPLPRHISSEKIMAIVDYRKDVDCLHPINIGKVILGAARILPCTPAGIIRLLQGYNIEISGKECVVIGRSNIVGKPMAILLLSCDGTVTVCHSKTQNLTDVCKRADILISAIGRPKFITKEHVKPGAVVVDVGNTKGADGKLEGDVDFEQVARVASAITPVPGGVGPMTVAMLMYNTLEVFKMQREEAEND